MHDWFQFAIAVAVLLLGGAGTVLGWIVNRFVSDLDELEEDQETLRNEQGKHSREIRDTRQAISRIEGRLDMDPFPYTSE